MTDSPEGRARVAIYLAQAIKGDRNNEVAMVCCALTLTQRLMGTTVKYVIPLRVLDEFVVWQVCLHSAVGAVEDAPRSQTAHAPAQ